MVRRLKSALVVSNLLLLASMFQGDVHIMKFSWFFFIGVWLSFTVLYLGASIRSKAWGDVSLCLALGVASFLFASWFAPWRVMAEAMAALLAPLGDEASGLVAFLLPWAAHAVLVIAISVRDWPETTEQGERHA